jgi:HEPN domain-containing protein
VTVANRWADWYAQSRHDLEHAEALRPAGRYDWACFAAHQAAEKAVKALHLRLGQEAWGHVVARLLAELRPAEVAAPTGSSTPAACSTRSTSRRATPTATRRGRRSSTTDRLQGEEALRHARDILAFVDQALAER